MQAHDGTTPPVTAGGITFGDKESETRPFEPATVDFSVANEMRRRDPTYGHNIVPDAVVGSCSECCMETVNGKPNVLGRIHRKMVGGCSRCPVGQAGDYIQARNAAGEPMLVVLPDGSRRPMTQTELLYLEIDGTE